MGKYGVTLGQTWGPITLSPLVHTSYKVVRLRDNYLKEGNEPKAFRVNCRSKKIFRGREMKIW